MSEHAELQRFEYEKNAAFSLEKLYGSALQNVGYELRYENELVTKRYTFGIDIPLTALSSQNELYKKSALQKRLSITYEKESFKNQTRAKREKLLESVGALYEEYALFYERIVPLSQELLGLSEYAYKEGEGSLMEYLDSSRSYAQSRIEMLELKKTYYRELFELYKTTDTDFGEETCIK
jgi:outer membrane protein TolC